MKLKFLILIIAALSLMNLACSNKKFEHDKQPLPDTSEAPRNAQASTTTTQPQQPAQAPAQSKYQYPDDKGIGPVTNVELGPIDKKLAEKGENIFNTKCVACHQLDSRLVGPPLRNITKKNTPEFIMNYLLNTTEMQKKDPLLIKLVDEYKVIMPDQQLTKDDARSVLEYFRSIEK